MVMVFHKVQTYDMIEASIWLHDLIRARSGRAHVHGLDIVFWSRLAHCSSVTTPRWIDKRRPAVVDYSLYGQRAKAV